MSTPDVTASPDAEARAGSRVLAVFENPLNTRILRAHADGPKRLAELQERVGWSLPQSTVRAAVSNLREFGALVKRPVNHSPYGVATALTPAGQEMLLVADEVDKWLTLRSPRAIDPGTEEAKSAVKALASGWSSKLIRALSNRPVTLTELDNLIPDISYPSLERRVSWMRTTGQIEAVEREGRGTPYVVTDWLRQAIAPLGVAGRCERRHLGEESIPITDVEVDASFLLVVPLVQLRSSARGTCILAVQTDSSKPSAERPELAGVSVEVEAGQVVSCSARVVPDARTWAVGGPEAWLDVVIDGRIDDLRIGGAKPQLALDLAAGLHLALFGEG